MPRAELDDRAAAVLGDRPDHGLVRRHDASPVVNLRRHIGGIDTTATRLFATPSAARERGISAGLAATLGAWQWSKHWPGRQLAHRPRFVMFVGSNPRAGSSPLISPRSGATGSC